MAFALAVACGFTTIGVGVAAAAVDAPTWTAASPPARQWPMMATDPVTGNVVMFGGDFSGVLNDTWIWDATVNAWSAQATATSPARRWAAGMAADPTSGTIVLFGGNQMYHDTYLGDTWVWDGTSATWVEQDPAVSPSARSSVSMATDPQTGNVVLFGGSTPDEYVNETWIWDGATWTEQDLEVSPSPRGGAAMAMDPATGNVVLFGGSWSGYVDGVWVSTRYDDTWIWDGTTWEEQSPQQSPSGRLATMAADPTAENVVLFGGLGQTGELGDTWTWDGTAGTWVEQSPDVSPPGRALHGMAATPGGGVVLFGGYDPALVAPRAAGDTWTWDGVGSTWTQHPPSSFPPPRSSAGMAGDPVSGNVVMFGSGEEARSNQGLLDSTWTWDGTTRTWTQRFPSTSPEGLRGVVMAFDPASSQVVAFGHIVHYMYNLEIWAPQTWTWDGQSETWTQQSTLPQPPARVLGAMATDVVNGNVVLFGGVGRQAEYADTWVWDWDNTSGSGTWIQQTPTESPSPRYGAAMATDPATGAPLLFGGFTYDYSSGSTYHADTWTWDGTTWTEQQPDDHPSARLGAAMAADTAAGALVLFGGSGPASADLGDTWLWDDNIGTWTLQSPNTAPVPRGRAAMATDPVTGEVVVFGGYRANWGRINDTWQYRVATSVSVSSSGTPSSVRLPVSFTATVTPAPTGGTVTFRDGDGPISGCVDVAVVDGLAECTVTYSTLGVRWVVAAFSGFGDRLPATSLPLEQVVDRAPLTVTAEPVSVQYSDLLPELTVAYDGFVLGEGPEVLDGMLVCETAAVVTAAGQVLSPAGTYPITCGGLTAADYDLTFDAGTLTVAREDTVVRLAQNNPHAVAVAGTAKKPVTPAMTFTARIMEAPDGSYGDIAVAVPVTLTLTPVSDGGPITVTCTVDRVQPATATEPGFELVTCPVEVGTPINVYQVSLTVGGDYYRGDDTSVLTVYDPTAGGTTGAGVITNPITDNLAEVAYTAAYLKNGKTVQGKFLYVSRDSDGTVVHVLKGNVMSTLAITGTTGMVTGKATLDDVGNYTYILTGIDNRTTDVPNPTDHPDQYGQIVTDASGAAVGDLTFAPVAVTDGNIYVGK